MATTIVGCGVVRRVKIQNFKVFARKMKRRKALPHHKMTNYNNNNNNLFRPKDTLKTE